MENEEFELHSPVKTALACAAALDVTMRFSPPVEFVARSGNWIAAMLTRKSQLNNYEERALRIVNFRNADLPVQLVTGEDKTTDVVVEIFNEVNSSGRKLSDGDLAFPRIGGQWPEVRE